MIDRESAQFQPLPHRPVMAVDPQRLQEEIDYLEARLQEIGHDGDCAYEKAMIKFFSAQVAVRRERLRTI